MPKHKHSEVIKPERVHKLFYVNSEGVVLKPDAFSFANLELVMEDGELISAKVL